MTFGRESAQCACRARKARFIHAEGKAAPGGAKGEGRARGDARRAHGQRGCVPDNDLNPNPVRRWVAKAGTKLSRVFTAAENDRARERELAKRREEVDDLHRRIDELTAKRDYLQRDLLSRYGVDIEDVPRGLSKR